jgi:hypothetical protein
MQMFDRFEKNFLFGLTRIFAMLIIMGILIAVGIGGVLFTGVYSETNTKVSTAEVIDAIKPPVTESSQSGDSSLPAQPVENINILPSVKMPFILQKHFNTPDNLQSLKGWLDSLPKDNHQEFIDEMVIMVTEAEKLNLPPHDAINKYKELKLKKLAAAQLKKAEQRTKQLYYAGAIISGVALIALFSLVLVLLAIERNTRRIK